MKRVFLAFCASWLVTFIGAIALFGCLEHPIDMPKWISPLEILFSSFAVSLFIVVLFFFIRRWDGCIEKLGGLTFTLLPWLLSMLPIYILIQITEPAGHTVLFTVASVLSIEFVFAGLITTHYLRTCHFDPPKPNKPWTW